MTTPDHSDRRIAALFEEGPARVSESTIDFALAHARSNPRRRDPLGALRRDPMGRGAFGMGRMTRPLTLVAAAGLLAVAALGGAAMGGLLDQRPAVVPPVVSPSPSIPPSAPPSPATIRVDLIEHVGQDAFIDVVDASFTLVEAVSGDPGDGVGIPDGEVQVENDADDPRTIVVTWGGGVCDTSHELVIEPDGRTLRMSRPACQGDSLGGQGHILRLTFDSPAPAAAFDVTLVTTP